MQYYSFIRVKSFVKGKILYIVANLKLTTIYGENTGLSVPRTKKERGFRCHRSLKRIFSSFTLYVQPQKPQNLTEIKIYFVLVFTMSEISGSTLTKGTFFKNVVTNFLFGCFPSFNSSSTGSLVTSSYF